MTLTELIDAARALDPRAFYELHHAIQQQDRERRTRARSERAQAELLSELREAGTIPTPDDTWTDPGTAHALMYLYGDEVTHGGRRYRSEHRGLNSWEPGAPGVDFRIWRDITDEGAEDEAGIPLWAPGQSYQVGDEVSYQGQRYRVRQAHTSQEDWTPDSVASLYEAIY